MNATTKLERIEVWRPADFTQLELRRGVAVASAVPRHWHEEYQLCLIQTGAGELTYRGSNHPTPPASLFLVHPGEVHSNRSFDAFGCSYRAVYVGAELMRGVATEARGKEAALPFFLTAVVFDQEVIRRYLRLYGALEQAAARLERETLLLDLLTALVARFAEQPWSPRSFGTERRAVHQACEFLNAHFAENVSLETLARLANLSSFHFHRVFTEQVGLPPHAYQTQLRVFRAKELLRDGWTIPQVAAQAGFFDQSHLHRHFKRLVGVSPGAYRRNSKNVQYRADAPC